MAALGKFLRRGQFGLLLFFCPGCKTAHQVSVGEGPGPRWQFNGNAEAPTFAPSILCTGTQIERDDGGKWTGEWLRGPDGQPLKSICHSFMTDGRIQFLGDCTHALAGQTVDLPIFPGYRGETL